MVPLPERYSRQRAIQGHFYEVNMTFVQGAITWFRRVQVLSGKILIFILVKEIVLYTGKSPLEATVIQ